MSATPRTRTQLLAAHRRRRAAEVAAMAATPVRPMLSAPVLTGRSSAPVSRTVVLSPVAPVAPVVVLVPRPTYRAVLSGTDGRTGATGIVPAPDVTPSHLPTDDGGNVGPVGFQNTSGPWNVTPWREGVPVNVTRDGRGMAPRQHSENVGWCRCCGAVARSSDVVTHGRRCAGADPVGCHLPSALDGPDVLTGSARVAVDARTGRSVLVGAAVVGTGATIRPESTPDMTARSAQRSRSSARRADGGRIVVSQLHNYDPAVPVKWLSTPTDPTMVRYRAMVERAAEHADRLSRLSVATGTGRARHLPSRLVVVDYRETRRLSWTETVGWVAAGERAADAYRAMVERLSAPAPAPARWTVPVKVTVLRANGEPLKTVRRRSRAAILAATAPAPMVAPVAADVVADAAAMVAADRIG